jgi:hypothetical protein
VDIGEQQRVIIVEPLTVPDEFPLDEPGPVTEEAPEPEKVPVRTGSHRGWSRDRIAVRP